MINLDYKTNADLFDGEAKRWAEKIGKGVKNTQIRKFYDYILEYNEKSKKLDNAGFVAEILPFIKMLNSKVAYASTRSSGGGKLINAAFVEMMNDGIKAVDSKESLLSFKLFFEAVIGFHRAIEATPKDR